MNVEHFIISAESGIFRREIKLSVRGDNQAQEYDDSFITILWIRVMNYIFNHNANNNNTKTYFADICVGFSE